MASSAQPKKSSGSNGPRFDRQVQALMADFGRAIHRARGRTSQVELGERTGLDQGTISLYERGLRMPSFENLMRVEQALGLNRGAIVHAVYCDLPTIADQLVNDATLPPEFRKAVATVYESLHAMAADD
jgi:transcriptional regulator with XRE-family HTH domain